MGIASDDEKMLHLHMHIHFAPNETLVAIRSTHEFGFFENWNIFSNI